MLRFGNISDPIGQLTDGSDLEQLEQLSSLLGQLRNQYSSLTDRYDELEEQYETVVEQNHDLECNIERQRSELSELRHLVSQSVDLDQYEKIEKMVDELRQSSTLAEVGHKQSAKRMQSELERLRRDNEMTMLENREIRDKLLDLEQRTFGNRTDSVNSATFVQDSTSKEKKTMAGDDQALVIDQLMQMVNSLDQSAQLYKTKYENSQTVIANLEQQLLSAKIESRCPNSLPPIIVTDFDSRTTTPTNSKRSGSLLRSWYSSLSLLRSRSSSSREDLKFQTRKSFQRSPVKEPIESNRWSSIDSLRSASISSSQFVSSGFCPSLLSENMAAVIEQDLREQLESAVKELDTLKRQEQNKTEINLESNLTENLSMPQQRRLRLLQLRRRRRQSRRNSLSKSMFQEQSNQSKRLKNCRIIWSCFKPHQNNDD